MLYPAELRRQGGPAELILPVFAPPVNPKEESRRRLSSFGLTGGAKTGKMSSAGPPCLRSSAG